MKKRQWHNINVSPVGLQPPGHGLLGVVYPTPPGAQRAGQLQLRAVQQQRHRGPRRPHPGGEVVDLPREMWR